jgi:hypothetical protein
LAVYYDVGCRLIEWYTGFVVKMWKYMCEEACCSVETVNKPGRKRNYAIIIIVLLFAILGSILLSSKQQPFDDTAVNANLDLSQAACAFVQGVFQHIAKGR